MKEENLLISKVAQGDKNALNEIYTLHSRKVYNMILNRFNDKSLADDIAQEVFITVYEKSINFRGDSQVSTWIFRIAINKCLDELKRKKKINDHILKESFQTIEYEDDSKSSVNLTTILKAIDELKQNQKEAFTLVYLDKIPQQEASEILNMNIKAFESLLYRARLSLQRTLSKTKDF
jgi:RNA polymerase sigma-70 factor (ECF subfamily)